MMMMMQGGSMGDSNSILPLLMLSDDSLDFKSFFLYSNMPKQDCDTSTDSQFSSMLPLLLMSDDSSKKSSSSDSLMMMLMMQSMGDSPVGINNILPFLMMGDKSDDDSMLLMVMMNSMTGGLNSQSGFDNSFNMLLPMLMKDCADT